MCSSILTILVVLPVCRVTTAQNIKSPKPIRILQTNKNQLSYKPSTIAEKLRRLRRAIGFIVDQNFGNAEVAQVGLQYRELLSFWINSLSRQISLQRHKRDIKIENEIAHTTNPKHFLRSEEVKLKLLYAKENISKGVYNTHVMRFMTAFVAAILLYKNGQRSGVIEN